MVFRADSVRFEACATLPGRRATPSCASAAGSRPTTPTRRRQRGPSRLPPAPARSRVRQVRSASSAATPTSGCAWPCPSAFFAVDFLVVFAGAFFAAAFFAVRLARRRATGLRAGAGQAGLERGHEVEHLGRLLGRGRRDDLLARGLALDQREHLFAVLVVVLLGIELARERVDELARHLELALARLGLRVDQLAVDARAPRRRSAWSRGRACRRSAGWRPAPPSSGARSGPTATLFSSSITLRRAGGRPSPRPCRARGSRAARSTRGRSRRGRRSPRSRSAAGLRLERGELVVVEHHVVAVLELVALHDLVVGHLFAGLLRHPAVADAARRCRPRAG